ncbi:hypothetical protein GCM10010191_05090 [Actinomadura vinacea]|uniref:Uncharacterized protein n=1 Tax=Actinomadura vinacea TaxID=115336 RepID=A0ABN3IDM7_9ACTN
MRRVHSRAAAVGPTSRAKGGVAPTAGTAVTTVMASRASSPPSMLWARYPSARSVAGPEGGEHPHLVSERRDDEEEDGDHGRHGDVVGADRERCPDETAVGSLLKPGWDEIARPPAPAPLTRIPAC